MPSFKRSFLSGGTTRFRHLGSAKVGQQAQRCYNPSLWMTSLIIDIAQPCLCPKKSRRKKRKTIVGCQWMNILALLITVLIPTAHINNENELNESLCCVSLQRCPSLAPCPMPAHLAGTTEMFLWTQRVPRTRNSHHLVSLRCICLWYFSTGEKILKGWSLFISFGWLARRGQKKGVGVEDVMSSHGLSYPHFVADWSAPPPQCLLNSGCLLVPVPSVPISLSSCCACAIFLSFGSHAAGCYIEIAWLAANSWSFYDFLKLFQEDSPITEKSHLEKKQDVWLILISTTSNKGKKKLINSCLSAD